MCVCVCVFSTAICKHGFWGMEDMYVIGLAFTYVCVRIEIERESTRMSIVPWVRSRSLSPLNIITSSIYTHTHVHTHMCTHTCAHTHTHTHTHTHARAHTHTHNVPIIMPLNQIYNQRGNVPSSPPCHNPAGTGIGKLIQGLAGAVGWCPRASAEQGGRERSDSGG